jgi:AbrB family looped-hinge helix DNA binding protein
MITTVTQKNRMSIPSEIRRKRGIKPGYKPDWQPIEGKEEILIKIIPDRAELARRFAGLGAKRTPERDIVAELDSERETDS